MEKLKSNWLTEGLIDFEYKKYILLAYLKQVSEKFQHSKLYPQLGELISHYQNLIAVQNNQEVLFDQFPRRISKVDMEKLKVIYQRMVEDDDIMKEIKSVISYALPRIKNLVEEGTELYEFVERNLEIDPVGLMPIYDREGYLFLSEDLKDDLLIYQYQVSVFEKSNENYRSIKTTFIGEERKGLARTVENIKLDLIRRFKEFPNPATWLVTSRIYFPIQETLLPIAKRHLIKQIQ